MIDFQKRRPILQALLPLKIIRDSHLIAASGLKNRNGFQGCSYCDLTVFLDVEPVADLDVEQKVSLNSGRLCFEFGALDIGCLAADHVNILGWDRWRVIV
jgi:hypothetical protein